MKTDIKILRIMYVIIFIVGFVLFFHYNNEKELNVEETEYTYEITDIEEEKDSIVYTVNIEEPYSDDALKKISEEIREDYNHIYNLKDVGDKVEHFEISFNYDNKVYKVLSNDYKK